MKNNFKGNIERFSGFADQYDSVRPTPPKLIVELAKRLYNQTTKPLIVDIGCGTGLSTKIWSEYASKVIGIDPNSDMLERAKKVVNKETGFTNVSFLKGTSSETGLESDSIDIVSCSQALHWLEPQSTFKEVKRILKHGGLFLAYDSDWPPSLNWQAEQEWIKLFSIVNKLDEQRREINNVRFWPKEQHLQRIIESNQFRFVREVVIHCEEEGNAERFINLAISQGQLMTILKEGLDEDEIGLTSFKSSVKNILGTKTSKWIFSYRIRIGVK